MAKFAQSFYTVKNPEKYVGKKRPYARSSWETHFMMFLDNNQAVVQWASEPVQIPYVNPFKPAGKQNTIYVPDFLIVYIDQNGKQHAELIEIKPKNQAVVSESSTQQQKMLAALNYCKWEAAKKWCAAHGLGFRILTEEQIFRNPTKRK